MKQTISILALLLAPVATLHAGRTCQKFQGLMTPTKVIFAGSVTRPTAEKALFHWVFCRPRDLTRRLVRLLSVPSRFGKLHASFFQPLENRGAMTSNAWN